MRKLYSIAVCPPAGVSALMRELKRKVGIQIGWYHSKNAEAHITFIEFWADDIELQIVTNVLKRFSAKAKESNVSFSGIASFVQSGTIFIEPTNDSADYLKDLLKSIPFPKKVEAKKSYVPHMTIARRLKKDQFAKAMSWLRNKRFDVDFHCDAIVLREFDSKREQYNVKSIFRFENDLQPFEGDQFSLFA